MNAQEWEYCRFCAESKLFQELVNLPTVPKVREEIYEKLEYCGVNLIDFSSNNLPETICNTCLTSLNDAYQFFAKIKISQAVLTSLVSCTLKSDVNLEHTTNYSDDDSNTFNDQEIELPDSKRKISQDFLKRSGIVSRVVSPIDEKLRNDSWTVYPWLCKHCGARHDSIKALREHSCDVHKTCFGNRCADCNINVSNFEDFVQHVRSHRDALKDICPYCDIKMEDGTHTTIHISQPNCSSCGQIFKTKVGLQRHVNKFQGTREKKSRKRKVSIRVNKLITAEQSWKDYPWTCLHCEKVLPDLSSTRNHLKEVHGKCFGVKCVDCDDINKKAVTFQEFTEHVVEHRTGLTLYCQYCDYRSATYSDNIIHVHKHTGHQCKICGEIFKNGTDLREHTSIYNPRKPRKLLKKIVQMTIEDLTCDICLKVFKHRTSLLAHKKVHTERKRDFYCDRCGKSFYMKGQLKTHKLLHDRPEPQICKICDKSFLTLARLKLHLDSHYDVKRFQCDVCKRFFRLKGMLKDHLITHTDLMPYSCKCCGRKFKFKSALKNHEVVHTGARPFFCQECPLAFTTWANCNKHMLHLHGKPFDKSAKRVDSARCVKLGPSDLLNEDVVEWTQKILAKKKRGNEKE